MTRNVKPISRPPLKQIHKYKRIAWAEKYMKTNFYQALFKIKARVTLDGPDGRLKLGVLLHLLSRIVFVAKKEAGELCFGRV